MRAAPALAASLLLAACGHAAPATDERPPVDPVQSVEGTELFQQGIALAQSGDLLRAEQYLGAAILRGYPEERALPALLKVCIAASRLRIALGYAEPYLDRNPNDWSLRLLVASLHLGLGDPVKARRELEQVVGTAPSEAEPHYLMAVLLRDEVGDPEGAAEHFRQYLALAPEGAHAQEVEHALEHIHIAIPNPLPEPSPTAADGSEVPEETEP